MRPYLFKEQAYRYEQEIRFVFGVHHEVAESASGVLVELDGKTLVQDVLVSDSIEKDEAELAYRKASCGFTAPPNPITQTLALR